ncbi:MAG: NifB/NifX family molybdenum-iron cluster-binding protein [Nitrospirota bacterium]
MNTGTAKTATLQNRSIKRPNVAVASFNGIEVDLHIGHARQLWIYGPGEDGLVCMRGARATPGPGGGEARWKALAEVLGDCFALLASGAGPKPMKILEDQGIAVFITEGNIKGSVDIVFGRGK